jgi:hypothetical protein
LVRSGGIAVVFRRETHRSTIGTVNEKKKADSSIAKQHFDLKLEITIVLASSCGFSLFLLQKLLLVGI